MPLSRIPGVVVGVFVVAFFVIGCPVADDGGETPPGACLLGEVSATSTGEDISGCLTTVATRPGTVALALGNEITIDLELFGEPPALPETWGDNNSTTFATITRGALQWQIADGSFDGGAPVGEGETVITSRDGDVLHGTFSGVAVSTSVDALIESLFVEASF